MKQPILLLASVATMLCSLTFASNDSAEKTILNSDDLAITESVEGVLSPADFHTMRDGLRYSKAKFEQTKKGTVAFVGGSITAMKGWRDMLCDYLTRRFPDTEFTFIAAGISSHGSTSGSHRLERDVFSKGEIDLLFEEAAVNDRSLELRRTSTDRIKGMEGVVRHSRKTNPKMDVVIMNFVDQYKIDDYNSGKTPQEIIDFDRVADHYGVPTINLAKEITYRINAGEFTWEDDFKNLHPSPAGQRIYYRSMRYFLESAYGCDYAEDDKGYDIPKEKVDPKCYDRARLASVEEAKLGEGWSFDPSLQPTPEGKNYRDGTTNIPYIVAEGESQDLTFKFKGSSIGFVCLSGPDAGAVEYSIDGGEYKLFDLWTDASKNINIARFFMLENELSAGKHTLKMRLAPKDKAHKDSIGNACRISDFLVNN